jgi:hypothetical protein
MHIKNIDETFPAPGYFRLCNDDGEFRVLDATGRRYRLRPESGTPVVGVAATGTINPAGADNSILYTAITAGAAGNGITITYLISGVGSAVLTVVTTDRNIVVTAGSATIASAVVTAVNADATAAALVLAAASGTVTGAIAAVAATNLTGGVNATTASKGDQMIDGDYLYTATANVAISSTSGWEKSAVAAV